MHQKIENRSVDMSKNLRVGVRQSLKTSVDIHTIVSCLTPDDRSYGFD
jgi:hypothetical protein